jgi:hypothetical protein
MNEGEALPHRQPTNIATTPQQNTKKRKIKRKKEISE